MEDDSSLVDSVYDVAVDPNRYDDLVGVWVEKLGATLNQPLADPQLEEHIGRAAQMLERSLINDEASAAEPEIEPQAPQPFFTLDPSGIVLHSNTAASTMYGVTEGNRLAGLPFDHFTIENLRAHLKNPPQNQLLRGTRAQDEQVVLLTVSNYTENCGGVLAVRTADVVWSPQLAAVLKESFGLSPSEVDIVELLVAGKTLEAAAQQRSRSLATVRTQVRTIYSKTATTGLPELLRMVLSLAPLFPTVANKSSNTTTQPRDDQRYLLTLADGRKLDYAVFGAENGRPVLFLHDALFCYAWTPAMVRMAEDMDLKIIAPARQYWANSDPYPEGVSSQTQYSADVEALLEHLDLRDIVVMARTFGAAYAYRIIANNPERYIGILGVVPALPMGSKADLDALPPHQRFLTKSVRHNKSLLSFLSKAGHALYKRSGAKAFLRMVYRGSKPDMELMEDPEAYAAMTAGMRLAEHTGYASFYHDFVGSPLSSWVDDLGLPVPMHAIIGEHDTNSRAKRIARLNSKGADISLTVVPGAAELLFYSHPDVVLNALNDLFVQAANADKDTVNGGRS